MHAICCTNETIGGGGCSSLMPNTWGIDAGASSVARLTIAILEVPSIVMDGTKAGGGVS